VTVEGLREALRPLFADEDAPSLTEVVERIAALTLSDPLDVDRQRAFVNFVRQWWGDSYGFTMAAAGNDGVVADDFADMTRDLAELGIALSCSAATAAGGGPGR
jgi:hypothetical protein